MRTRHSTSARRRRSGLLLAVGALVAASVAVGPAGAVAGAAEAPPVQGPEAGVVPPELGAQVIGGGFISISAQPWTVALVTAGAPNAWQGQFCGGTLIAPDLVFTAAHCVTIKEPTRTLVRTPASLRVVLGRSDLLGSGGETRTVRSVHVHPGWTFVNRFRNDFALLRLGGVSNQTPAALPAGNASALWAPGVQTVVSGWGCTQAGVSKEAQPPCNFPSQLKAGVEVMQSDGYCQGLAAQSSVYAEYHAGTMLCVQDPANTTGACFGDSGGPLTVQALDSRWYLVGDVSFGLVPCSPAWPSMFGWVPASYAWINQLTSGPYWPGRDIVEGAAIDPTGWGSYVLDAFGGIHPLGLAPHINGPYWPGWDIARGMALGGVGRRGYLVDAFGGLHRLGGAPAPTGGPYWPGWDIARDVALVPGTYRGAIVDAWGGIHRFGPAGTLNRAGAPYWPGWDIVRGIALLPGGTGGYVLDGFGGLHRFGNAPVARNGPYWNGRDLARGVTLSADGTAGFVVDAYGGRHAFSVG
jgi:secreted trypsin-like serine protease